jgi:hypothetical protein
LFIEVAEDEDTGEAKETGEREPELKPSKISLVFSNNEREFMSLKEQQNNSKYFKKDEI